jgi:hypothetical protein
MLQLGRTIVGVALDVLRLVVSFLRRSSAIRAENLVLRKQLVRYIERGIKPKRVDHATRVSLALFTRLFDWRDSLVVVRPSTVVRWHRLGWRVCWRSSVMVERYAHLAPDHLAKAANRIDPPLDGYDLAYATD